MPLCHWAADPNFTQAFQSDEGISSVYLRNPLAGGTPGWLRQLGI